MIDLHMHSIFSDGSLTPEELVVEAERSKVSAIALTDHDTVDGLSRFLAAAEAANIRAFSGIEISVDFSPGSLHMLGYGFDPTDAAFLRELEWIRDGRDARNREILQKLNDLGLELTWEEVEKQAGGDVVGRPHFALAMLARGYVADKDDAFDRYLAKGKPAYAERRRFSAADAIRCIGLAGGVASLAHPFSLGLGPVALDRLVADLKAQGLAGIESYYSEYTADQQREYLSLCNRYDLVPTGGSDFHGALNPDIRMGVGFGSLRVPDDVADRLAARLAQ